MSEFKSPGLISVIHSIPFAVMLDNSKFVSGVDNLATVIEALNSIAQSWFRDRDSQGQFEPWGPGFKSATSVICDNTNEEDNSKIKSVNIFIILFFVPNIRYSQKDK